METEVLCFNRAEYDGMKKIKSIKATFTGDQLLCFLILIQNTKKYTAHNWVYTYSPLLGPLSVT
jgi:hypothetical protein